MNYACFSAATLSVALVAAPVGAQPLTLDDVIKAEILPGWTTKRGTHMAGLSLRLAPGWKTYWRAPGDAGIPPQFSFAGSDNLRGIAIHWPSPEVFDQGGYRSIGYVGDVVIPIELAPGETGQGISLNVNADLGVCSDICVPVSLSFSAELPAEGGTRHPAIAAALLDRPATAAEAGLTGITCAVSPAEKGLTVTATIDMPASGPGEFAVFEHPDQSVWVAQARTERSGGRLTAVTRMEPTSGGALMLDRSDLIITILTDNGSVEIRGCPAA